ncbi:Hypothetical predicted protein [Pelobates cultripes]|uniref:Uncharacterized protein n=1 Tax=Pelobates cultripes TaxID=61616 RepID=A0AAD1T3N5_PELCU|nr:Hypothetical predicted protein [Pelobates cultripes]
MTSKWNRNPFSAGVTGPSLRSVFEAIVKGIKRPTQKGADLVQERLKSLMTAELSGFMSDNAGLMGIPSKGITARGVYS